MVSWIRFLFHIGTLRGINLHFYQNGYYYFIVLSEFFYVCVKFHNI